MRSSRLMTIKNKQASKISKTPTIEFDDSVKRNPSFFSIILSPITQQSKLRIPTEFVKKYGRHLSDEICLNVPNCSQAWKVKLEKDKNKNDMFFGKGWEMLMEFYSLGYGHLLVFRFDGCLPSQFHVLIFNKTATEIDYPLRRTPPLNSNRKLKKEYHTQEADDDDDDDDDVSLEMLDEIPPKPNKTESVINNLDSSDSDCNVKCSSIKEKGYDGISHEARKNLKKKLSVIKSEYPNFKTIMYPTHVRYRYNLGVNFSHASTYLARDKSDKVILKGPNGKNYRVGLYFSKTTAKFTDGWKDFVADNGLNVGDGCMFELVKRPPNNVYQVSIFRI